MLSRLGSVFARQWVSPAGEMATVGRDLAGMGDGGVDAMRCQVASEWRSWEREKGFAAGERLGKSDQNS